VGNHLIHLNTQKMSSCVNFVEGNHVITKYTLTIRNQWWKE